MNGIIVIDKPAGYTSFDVVAVMRKICATKKIGHAGTLDPMATGVLPILVGNATKAQELFPDTDKTYLAAFRFGLTTDTQDITGKILSETRPCVKKREVIAALSQFRGKIMQVPPMYSALKKNGKKLYELARQGVEVQRDAREITIFTLELQSFDEESFEGELLVTCSKGTYIRKLCADLGELLGCGAVLTQLRRTKACGFSIEQSISLQRAKELAQTGELSGHIAPVQAAFSLYPEINISPAQAKRFKNGGSLSLDRLADLKSPKDGEHLRIFAPDRTFLGLGVVSLSRGEVRFLKLFCQ